jgi:two-component system chemotaxis response regulator CheY
MSLILAVDDSASLRQMVAFTLRASGYEVIEAQDADEALAALRRHDVDLVLTDRNMPGTDGIELVRLIRARPEQRQLPILLFTTETGEEIRQAGRAAGATGWLVKPFDPKRLVEVVRRVLMMSGAPAAAPAVP